MQPTTARPPAPPPTAAVPASEVREFRATRLYTGASGEPVGARYVHVHTGFELALIAIDTAPQSYVWVHTPPSSHQGLPHTQEHLLLGKGNKGRAAAARETMSMVESSAFTASEHTAYHLHTTAGVEVFFEVFASQLDALLHPDYTDEEIRREVHHYGVAGEPGALRLEDKGTIYNEMVGTYNQPGGRAWLARQEVLYGAGHPLALSQGGIPDAIRTIEPEHIRAFHRQHYQLGNMGAVVVLPAEVPLDDALRRLDRILVQLQPAPGVAGRVPDLPPPRPHPGDVTVGSEYPSLDPTEAVSVSLAWPPRLELDDAEETLLHFFLSGLAGGVGTNLYGRFVDGSTRTLKLEARATWAWADDHGLPVTVGVSGVPATTVDQAALDDLRAQVRDELAKIAAWAPGDPALVAFNDRLRGQVISAERQGRVQLSKPLGFGNRSSGSYWYEVLQGFEKGDGVSRSLVGAPELAWVRGQLDRPDNPWTEHLARWGLLEPPPYTFTERPSPELHASLGAERDQRLREQLDRLRARLGAADDQAALAAFAEEIDAATAALDAMATQDRLSFLEAPPLTHDPWVEVREDTLYILTALSAAAEAGSGESALAAASSLPGTSIPRVFTPFATMPGAHLTLSLPLRGMAEADLLPLQAFLVLATQVGVVEDGIPIDARSVVERLRLEVETAALWAEHDPRTGRSELTLYASGTTTDEAARAMAWVRRFLLDADLRPENLPRVRDVLDQALVGYRRRPKGREEAWVHDPAEAWRWQRDPLYLATASLFTREHDALRMRYLVREASPAAITLLREVGDAGRAASRQELLDTAGALRGERPPPAVTRPALRGREALPAEDLAVLDAVGRDLEAELPRLPPESLGQDWRYLCRRLAADLEVEPATFLGAVAALRDRLLRAGGARVWIAAAEPTLPALEPALAELVAPLRPGAPAPGARSDRPLGWTRLEGRGVDTSQRVFAGLVVPTMQGAVVEARAPLTSYEDLDEEHLLDLLSARVPGGGAGHSLFMRTWGAGLAYSNGSRASEEHGEVRYYAERCPSLVQTLSFVASELESLEVQPWFGEYALAQSFDTRLAGTFEQRGRAQANELAEGLTPAKVRAFREGLLGLRGIPDLADELVRRLPTTLGRVVPGYGVHLSEVDGLSFFTIGTEAHLAELEGWLRQVERPDAVVHRLAPRDFWRVEDPP